MAAIMSAFSIASVFGVPAGLELAHRGGWRLPFFTIGTLAMAVWAVAFFNIPALRAHIERALRDHPWKATRDLLRRRDVLYAYGTLSVGMCASFLLIPKYATILEFNLGFPRADLGKLYLEAGLVTLVFVLIAGRFVDRWTATLVSALASIALITFVFYGLVRTPPGLSIPNFFIGFIAAVSVRSVAGTTIASRVPEAHERARFTALLTTIQNAMSAIGAITSSFLLSADLNGKLEGMPKVALLSIFISVFVVLFVALLENLLKKNLKRDQIQGSVTRAESVPYA
jgi:predicted MFS family arabinose efflux permease